MSLPPAPFSITSHPQDTITVLQTNPSLSKTIVDWGLAESISRLSNEIINPPPPYTPSDAGFDNTEWLLPEHTTTVVMDFSVRRARGEYASRSPDPAWCACCA